MDKLDRTATEHVLPFADLSPKDFERLCLWLLRQEGYENVDHVGAGGSDDGCDLSAKKSGEHWVCQCKRVRRFGLKEAENELDKILNWPENQRPDGLLFIVACDISAKTRAHVRKKAEKINCEFWPITILDERVKKHENILAEFFQLKSPVFDPYIAKYGFAVNDYLRAIDTLVKQERIQDFFVLLAGEFEKDKRIEHIDVWSFVTKWLEYKNNKPLAILGDYGTGKSWLCLLLTKELANAFRDEPNANPLPILLSFKSYRSGMDINDLIPIAMARDYGITSCDNYKIQQLVRERKAILILDGLDEMARELGHRDALVQFARLGIPATSTTIVTCRTHYFLSGTEQREVLNPDAAVLLSNSSPNFDILHLKLLNETRVNDAIRCRVKTGMEERVISFVRSTYNLPELCARPVLLSMVCQSYEAIEKIERDVTSADLYESYLKAWLVRELKSGRIDFAPEDVIKVLEIIAEKLVRRNTLWLSVRDFEQIVSQFGAELGHSEIDIRNLVRQLATCTFLRRTRGDGWEFVHRSFQEYLYAKRFFRWERENSASGDFSVLHVPAWQFISQLVLREWNNEKAEKWIVERVSREQEPSLCKTTLRAAAAYWLLHCGSRPASEYSLRGIMLDWVDLRRVDLSRADLTKSDLNSSDLRGANLHGAILRDSYLVSADFSGADLSYADFRGSDCRNALFKAANTSNVSW